MEPKGHICWRDGTSFETRKNEHKKVRPLAALWADPTSRKLHYTIQLGAINPLSNLRKKTRENSSMT
jgi:hypothetical protein